MACIHKQIADRLNELEVPGEILRTKRMRHEFDMWTKGRRVMVAVDLPKGRMFVGFKVVKKK
jgi:hypothetical protein